MEQSVWKREKSDGHEDYGLLVSEPARKYAIVKELDSPVTLKDGAVVLQFEVRLQNGLKCGGPFAAPAPANLVDSLMER
ncbi:calnexin homolog [Triticum dicoccoides]|uniref:calnexin homolog n=1 Tax=Triticum dicoccoides TaxID=85692 RepID=UPI00188E8721|nr:calnexin homolog [Triticum dicoccoides]